MPESSLLSHDLFEGIFARAGLASDIEVVEEFPARYDVAARRHHRWARGDWQLLPWILGRGPLGGANRSRYAIPAIGRWKMLDNLRRTLSAPACMLSLLGGLALPLAAASVWIGFVLLTILLPALMPVFARHPAAPWQESRRAAISCPRQPICASPLAQWALVVTFLAHQAWLMGDAIARTLVRAVRHPPASPGMGSGRAGGDRSTGSTFSASIASWQAGLASACWRWRSPLLAGHGTWPLAVPLAAALGRIAGDRALDQPVPRQSRARCPISARGCDRRCG